MGLLFASLAAALFLYQFTQRSANPQPTNQSPPGMRSCGLAMRLTRTAVGCSSSPPTAGCSSAPWPSAAALASTTAAGSPTSPAAAAAGSSAGPPLSTAVCRASGVKPVAPLGDSSTAGADEGQLLLAANFSAGAAATVTLAERHGFPIPAGGSPNGWVLECQLPGSHAGALLPPERLPAPGPALAVRGRGCPAGAGAASTLPVCACTAGGWGPAASARLSGPLPASSAASRDALTWAICRADGPAAPLGMAGGTAAAGGGAAGWASCCSSAAVSAEAVVHRLQLPLAASESPPASAYCLLSWLADAAPMLQGRSWVAAAPTLALPEAPGAGSERGLTASTARGSSFPRGERSATRADAAPPPEAANPGKLCGAEERCPASAAPRERGGNSLIDSARARSGARSRVGPPLPAAAAAARRGRPARAVQRQARKQRCSMEACRWRAMRAT